MVLALWILLVFRLFNGYIIRTCFAPDEDYQNGEVANWIVNGVGFLSWEWEPCVALRGATHPLLFSAAPLYIAKVMFGIESGTAFAAALPRLVQSIFAAVGDYCFLRSVALSYYADDRLLRTFSMMCLVSWFSFFTICRGYSSAAEASLLNICLYFWIKSNLHEALILTCLYHDYKTQLANSNTIVSCEQCETKSTVLSPGVDEENKQKHSMHSTEVTTNGEVEVPDDGYAVDKIITGFEMPDEILTAFGNSLSNDGTNRCCHGGNVPCSGSRLTTEFWHMLVYRGLSVLVASVAVLVRPSSVVYFFVFFGLQSVKVLFVKAYPIKYCVNIGKYNIYSVAVRRMCRNIFVCTVVLGVTIGCSVVLGIGMAVDKWFYGKWVLPPWNFVLFNAASDSNAVYGENVFHFYATFGPLTTLLTFYPYLLIWTFTNLKYCLRSRLNGILSNDTLSMSSTGTNNRRRNAHVLQEGCYAFQKFVRHKIARALCFVAKVVPTTCNVSGDVAHHTIDGSSISCGNGPASMLVHLLRSPFHDAAIGVFVTLLCLSKIPHKEFRFLLPFHNLMLLACAQAFNATHKLPCADDGNKANEKDHTGLDTADGNAAIVSHRGSTTSETLLCNSSHATPDNVADDQPTLLQENVRAISDTTTGGLTMVSSVWWYLHTIVMRCFSKTKITRDHCQRDKSKLMLVVGCVFLPQLFLGFYTTRQHIKGADEIINFLRKDILDWQKEIGHQTAIRSTAGSVGGGMDLHRNKVAGVSLSIFYLTPCHNLPMYSRLPSFVPIGFFDCSPAASKKEQRRVKQCEATECSGSCSCHLAHDHTAMSPMHGFGHTAKNDGAEKYDGDHLAFASSEELSWRARFWKDPLKVVNEVFGDAAVGCDLNDAANYTDSVNSRTCVHKYNYDNSLFNMLMMSRSTYATSTQWSPRSNSTQLEGTPFVQPVWRHTRRASWFGGYTAGPLQSTNPQVPQNRCVAQTANEQRQNCLHSQDTVSACLQYRFSMPLVADVLPSHFVVSSSVEGSLKTWLASKGYTEVYSVVDGVFAEGFETIEWSPRYIVYRLACFETVLNG